jgi:hypothetical protein
MHDITRPRFSGSSMKNLRMFEKLVGEAALHNVVLVTNRWETVELKEGELRERELITNPNMWGDMIQKGSTVERYSGTTQEARRILKSVFEKKRRTILNIQQELIDRQLDLSETEAGQTLLQEINSLRLKYMREMTELRTDLNNALQAKDDATYELMVKHRSELEVRLTQSQDQISELKSQNGALEQLRRTHVDEIERLKESFEERLRLLEEQNSIPPPAYTDVNIQMARHGQTSALSIGPASAILNSSWGWSLLILLWELGQKLLRPQLRIGYRRLEWRCVRKFFLRSYFPC